MQGQWAAELAGVSSAAEQERASAYAQHAALEQQLRAAQVGGQLLAAQCQRLGCQRLATTQLWHDTQCGALESGDHCSQLCNRTWCRRLVQRHIPTIASEELPAAFEIYGTAQLAYSLCSPRSISCCM